MGFHGCRCPFAAWHCGLGHQWQGQERQACSDQIKSFRSLTRWPPKLIQVILNRGKTHSSWKDTRCFILWWDTEKMDVWKEALKWVHQKESLSQWFSIFITKWRSPSLQETKDTSGQSLPSWKSHSKEPSADVGLSPRRPEHSCICHCTISPCRRWSMKAQGV